MPCESAAIGVLSAISSLPVMAGSGPAEHEHEHDTEVFSAGEPGDPEKPSRVIQVTMQESDGKMLFVPSHVEVRNGEQNQMLAGMLTESFGQPKANAEAKPESEKPACGVLRNDSGHQERPD